ncbi:unnamed protein product, partial [Trichogramma brassicae]
MAQAARVKSIFCLRVITMIMYRSEDFHFYKCAATTTTTTTTTSTSTKARA